MLIYISTHARICYLYRATFFVWADTIFDMRDPKCDHTRELCAISVHMMKTCDKPGPSHGHGLSLPLSVSDFSAGAICPFCCSLRLLPAVVSAKLQAS